MYPILTIIAGTPYWVWGILAYLIYIGLQATRPHSLPLYRLAIMPFVFMIWSLYSLQIRYGMQFQLIGGWLFFCCVGICGGIAILQAQKISVATKDKQVHMPGSYIPLLFSLTFFGLKYFLGVTYALDPIATTNILFYGLDITVSGLISGISAGRFIGIVRRFK